MANEKAYLDLDGTAELWAEVTKMAVLVVSIPSFRSLPQTVTNSNITSDMVCIKAEIGTPAAQTSDWTVNTSNGSLTISGSINSSIGSGEVKLYLAKSR